ncbi:MAG: hypothetical protein R3E77_10160 [Steroidobacteraceae bacterium]
MLSAALGVLVLALQAAPGSNLHTLGRWSTRVNGAELSMSVEQSDASVEEVLAMESAAWRRQSAEPVIRSNTGEWVVLARRSGQFFETVQVRPQGPARASDASEIVRSRLALGRPVSPLPRLPLHLPYGWQIRSCVEHVGRDAAERTFIVSIPNHKGVQDGLARAAGDAGYRPIQSSAASGTGLQAASLFRRRDAWLMVSWRRTGDSAVAVLHERRAEK